MARFGKDGYEGASVREIARGAGVALGAVSQFFGSKRLLLLTSMDTLLRHLEAFGPPSFADRSTVERDLEKFLREVFARERPFIGVYRAWQEAALIDSMIAAYDRQIRTWTRWRIHALFGLLAGLPGARPRLDLEMLAELWDRFFWNLLAHPPSDVEAAVARIAQTLTHSLILDTSAESIDSIGSPRRRRRSSGGSARRASPPS